MSTIDERQPAARQAVENLHAYARFFADPRSPFRSEALAQVLSDAAVLLDEYQAGIALATPHALTGMALVGSGDQP